MSNIKGNIIVFALTSIAIMSLSAVVLFSTSLLEMRKSENLEKAVFAAYTAESSAEHSAYLINQALAAGKTLVDINDKIGEMTDCGDTSIIDCAKLQINLGASDLPVTLQQNQTLTVNLYHPENKNLAPPYENYEVDTMVLKWSEDIIREFEISFILWNIESGIKLLPPVKWRLPLGPSPITFNFDDICVVNPNKSFGEETVCEVYMTTLNQFILGADNIGIIRIKLLSPDSLMGGSLQLFKQGDSNPKLIPGFMEIKSTGQEKTNKQALRIVQKIEKAGTGSDFVSEIWDYAIFSNKSLLK